MAQAEATGEIAADLADELRVMIEPVTLGGGKRPFPDDGDARPMRTTTSRKIPDIHRVD